MANDCPFRVYLVPHHLHLCFFVRDFTVSKAQVLTCGPNYKNVVICLTKKMHVLEKLHSGTSYSVVREVNVNESTVRYIQKKEVEILGSICTAGLERTKVTSTVV